MNSEHPNQVDIEVLPPTDNRLTTPRTVRASVVIREFLLSIPPPTPVQRPVFTIADCTASFQTRLGIAVIASIQTIQHYISPDGGVGACLKFFLRWFIILIATVLVLGAPTLLAAHYISSVAELLYFAAQHIFYAVLYIVGACAVIAAAIALAIGAMKSANH